MKPGGTNPRMVLYRSELTPSATTNGFLGVATSTKTSGKNTGRPIEDLDGGRGLLDDYLIENLVDIKVTLNYLDASGVPVSVNPTGATTVNWTRSGFVGFVMLKGETTPTPIVTPNTPVSITVILTSLRPKGATLYESGAMKRDDAIQREGVVLSRTFPIVAQPVH